MLNIDWCIAYCEDCAALHVNKQILLQSTRKLRMISGIYNFYTKMYALSLKTK